MKLNTIITRAPYYYASRKTINLLSAPGRGKTDTVCSIPALLSKQLNKNIGLVIINGGLLNPPDSIGYLMPRTVTLPDGTQVLESQYTEPFWFRTKEGKRLDEYDGGIIFIDEADKMEVDVKKVIGEATLSGNLGPHRIPEGWVIWMAGNRQKDRSGSTKELDHLINRRMDIEIDDDIESLVDWMNRNHVHHLYRAFAEQNIHIVFSDGVPKVQGPWCTPRSLVEASRFHTLLPTGDDGFLDSEPETLEEISGMIGQAAAAQLFAFVRLEKELPAFADIVSNPAGTMLPTKPDAQMLICYSLANRATMATMTPVLEYINRMPKEFSVIFCKSAVEKEKMFLTLPRVKQWIKENASLMALMSGR